MVVGSEILASSACGENLKQYNQNMCKTESANKLEPKHRLVKQHLVFGIS